MAVQSFTASQFHHSSAGGFERFPAEFDHGGVAHECFHTQGAAVTG